MQPVDQPVRLVQLAPQIAGAGIDPRVATRTCPAVSCIDDFQFVRDVGDLVVESSQ
ncbi:hypothetical protein H7J86_00820 [Mycobacterium hackensackense]|uniref:hypothetical protein n=1 Tax=Mycobacterium hackensackense TaxID=228909 RepID=UPI001479DBE5|nr:hypothetical protein [Mycobacterium hackensackense]MCV7250700.1 hypothetical protein [Mycobacterium hackensackense]